MTAVPKPSAPTAEDYLAIERMAEYKSEFVDGEMFAMAGASMKHTIIIRNLVGELYAQTKGKRCYILAQDMRTKVQSLGNYFYPDIVGLCEKVRLEDNVEDTLLNPELILEVLSPSTEAYDRGKKFQHYQQIPTLCQYVLVSQMEPLAEIFSREKNSARWTYEQVRGMEATLTLSAIECSVTLRDIYREVDLSAPVPPGSR